MFELHLGDSRTAGVEKVLVARLLRSCLAAMHNIEMAAGQN